MLPSCLIFVHTSGSQRSFYPPENLSSSGTGVITSSAARKPLTLNPKSCPCDPKPQLWEPTLQFNGPESVDLAAKYPLTLHPEGLILDPKSLIKNVQSPSPCPKSLILDRKSHIQNHQSPNSCPESLFPYPDRLLLTSNPPFLNPELSTEVKLSILDSKSSSSQNPKCYSPEHKSLNPRPKSFINFPEHLTLDQKGSTKGMCTDPNCVESVCTDSSCCQNICSVIFCPGNSFPNCPIPQSSFDLTYPQRAQWCADESVPNLAQNSNIGEYLCV